VSVTRTCNNDAWSIGFRLHQIASITLTHYHPDHAGLANRVRAESHAPLALHSADVAVETNLRRTDQRLIWARHYARWGVPDHARSRLLDTVSQRAARPALAVDIERAEADILPIVGRRIVVIHVPGHSPGCIALRDDDLRRQPKSLVIGDHVLPTVESAIALRVASSSIADHHVRPSRQIAGYAIESGQTPWQIAQQLKWKSGWDALTGVRLGAATGRLSLPPPDNCRGPARYPWDSASSAHQC